MSPEKTIRIQARNKLANNNWPAAVGAAVTVGVAIMTVMYLISALDLAVSALFGSIDITGFLGESFLEGEEPVFEGIVAGYLLIPCIILLAPLFVGMLRYIYLMVKNGDADYTEMFYYLGGRRYFRTLGVSLGIFVRSLWQAAVSFLPSYIIYVLISDATLEKDNLDFFDVLCYFIVYVLLFGGILLFSKLSMKNFLSLYLYIEDENLTVSEMCSRSAMYMERFKGSVMKLVISLIPWMLSCILIIPMLFAVPYIMATLSTSAKWILALYYQPENKDE